MGATDSRTAMTLLSFILLSGFFLPLTEGLLFMNADAQGPSVPHGMQKLGEEYSKKSAEVRHRERVGLGNFASAPYSGDFGYRLVVDGTATRTSDNSTLEIHVTLHASAWKSAGSMVSMDILNGTIKVGDETYMLNSGDAHYLAHVRQLRIVAFASEGVSGEPFQVLVMKAKAPAGALPFPEATEPLQIEVLGPQSRLLPGFTIEMSGTVELTSAALKAKETTVVLNAILDHLGNDEIFHDLISAALEKLRQNHPDLDIQVIENTLPYPNEKTALIDSLANGTSVDLFSADQIWLGELADRGLLTDLTNYTESWARSSDWYQTNWDGGAYKGRTYGIWVWTDVRGIYYWKDLLNEAGVDPESLRTWSGYLEGAQKLNAELRPQGIEGVHLTGVGHSPDLWYPYLWMLGGEILEPRSGNPVHGDYWYPAFNSSAGVEALGFIRDQVQAGIVPQQSHDWGQEFADRKFAVMIEASHVPSYFDELSVEQLDDRVGYLPLFPVPNATTQTATLMGGWELTIPVTSQHKELAWELITLMVEPEVLSPWLAKYNYLLTQLPIGQGPYAQELRATNPFFDEMATLIQYGHGKPSIPEYPQIAEHIREAIDDVYYGRKDPKQALDDAAAKSAEALGWT